jgi:uncharacterized protein (TIGR00730 family)
MKICIFCSANHGIDHDFFDLTAELGTKIAKNGHSIVFGGTNLGLMDCLAKAAHESKGLTIGVVPTKVEENGNVSTSMDVHIPCADLSDRKSLMMDKSDLFIALPGGIGTLDEIFSVTAMATLGYHHKPIILYNMKGFWNSLIAMLDDLHARGVTRKDWRSYIQVADTIDDVMRIIDQAAQG